VLATPVPPYWPATTLPFHVPVAMVPTDVRLDDTTFDAKVVPVMLAAALNTEYVLPSLVYSQRSSVSFQRICTFVDEPRSISTAAFSDGAPVTSLFRTMMLSEMFSVVVLIVVVVPLIVRSPVMTTLPDTARDVSVPRDVRLEYNTLLAIVVPTMPLASAFVAGMLDALWYVNLLSIAVIAALRVVPQFVSPLVGMGVEPSTRYVVTTFSVSCG